MIPIKFNPIPTPALPLKGREKYFDALKLALMRADVNPVGLTGLRSRQNQAVVPLRGFY